MLVRTLKIILTVVILLAALAAGVVALFWRSLLTPEQKTHYGLYESAADDYALVAKSNPSSEQALSDYVEALVNEGNLGRAGYLCDMYGVDNQTYLQLREAVDKSLQAASRQEVYDLGADPAVAALGDLPAREAFRYLQGYRHALLGDWASARNYFEAINPKKLASELRPYHKYYLARSYRLTVPSEYYDEGGHAGAPPEAFEVEDLLLDVVIDHPDLLLRAKARYNLIAWYLSDKFPGDDGHSMAKGQELMLAWSSGGWALQRSYAEFAEYYLAEGELERAWHNAHKALMDGAVESVGKSTGRVCVDVLQAIAAGQTSKAPDEGRDWFLGVELPEGVFTTLAETAAKYGFAAEVAELFDSLKAHIAEIPGQQGRLSWEELRVGLAICYRAEKDSQGMSGLMADANLSGFSDASLAEIYYHNAKLLESNESYNKALSYYQSSARLGGKNAGDCWLRAYSILKQVQSKLDTARAIEFLTKVVEHHQDSPAFPKAVEELVPLLIFKGFDKQAHKLCDFVLNLDPGSYDLEARRTYDQTLEVANYWEVYLADKEGAEGRAAGIKGNIPLKYWNYYELTTNYPPIIDLEKFAALLQTEESPGEYFAGLGLTDSANEAFQGQGIVNSQLMLYFGLANSTVTKPVSSIQWQATELLESGVVLEQPLLEYVLGLAYPRPFADEVNAVANEFNVPVSLIYAVMKKETNFKADSVSWAGAQGLMQLMPDTASWLNGRYSLGLDLSDLSDTEVNIRLGGAYLRSLFDDLGVGNVRGVVHSYNGGPGNYAKWREGYPCDAVLFTDIVPNEQNETYAKKVIKYYKVYDWLGSD